MHRFLITAAFILPTTVFAAGSDDSAAPTISEEAKACMQIGKVLAEDGNTCVTPDSGALDDNALYQAARELAYFGDYEGTLDVLAEMSDPQDDRVLTYKGFVNRKMGNLDVANVFYQQAIDANPNNILARSYMAQGFVVSGDYAAAREQLIEIRLRGGSGTWAEASLVSALETGRTYSY